MAVAKLSDLPSDPKIAIVHDWFVGGGAEKVVEAIHQLYPDAPIYTSFPILADSLMKEGCSMPFLFWDNSF